MRKRTYLLLLNCDRKPEHLLTYRAGRLRPYCNDGTPVLPRRVYEVVDPPALVCKTCQAEMGRWLQFWHRQAELHPETTEE